MRRPRETIVVECDQEGLPTCFTTRGGRHQVLEVLDVWFERSRWWDGEPALTCYRLRAEGLYDLAHDSNGQWRLLIDWD